MKLIRIMNAVEDNVPRTYLEKLGISKKREDAETIGQFGSGVKLAPIAALRNDWRWIFAGKDAKSPYVLEYTKGEEVDGFEPVVYSYTDIFDHGTVGSAKETSFVIGAGELSWNEDFQIFREAFANALDEHTSNDAFYSVDIIDWNEEDIADLYIKGMFCVYLTADDRLMEFVDYLDRYFLVNRKPISEISTIQLYERYDQYLKIYNKGVLVWDGKDQPRVDKGCFDYNSSFLDLNEERRLENGHSQIYSYLNGFIRECSDIDLLAKFIPSFNDNSFVEYTSWYETTNHHLVDMWNKHIGESYCIAGEEPTSETITRLSLVDFKIYIVESDYWHKTLVKSGVKTISDALGVPMGVEVVTPSPAKAKVLARAMAIVKDFESAIDDCHVQVMRDNKKALFGLFEKLGGKNNIYVTESCLDSLEDTVGTLIHELDHYLNNYGEHDQKFRHFADKRIGHLMVNYSQTLKEME
jgi:hypothetical protein